MGIINYIEDPKNWKIDMCGDNKSLPNDIVYRMIIGYGDDEGCYEIYDYISKSNYESIMNKAYSIMTFPYSEVPIILFNEKGICIPMVKGTEIDYKNLNENQKQLVKKSIKKSGI